MIFEKDGVQYATTDQAIIDCFIAKGWTEVVQPKAESKTEKAKKVEKTVKAEQKARSNARVKSK